MIKSQSLGPSFCPVNSYNEWDLLEEIIVGTVDNAVYPTWNNVNRVTVPPEQWDLICRQRMNWDYFPSDYIDAAKSDINALVHILEAEGVKVRRPALQDHNRSFATPDWKIEKGFCNANPRDVLLVIGNEIIEAPMADRSRYFEVWGYRHLLKEYFLSGAKWTAAPKPRLLDELYDSSYRRPTDGEPMRFLINDFEPTFDAADFVRCGKDIFTHKSHVTNELGIRWLQSHLGNDYCIHELESLDKGVIHIDTTFVPLAPGKVLVNPEYLDVNRLPKILKKWEVLVAPKPITTPKRTLGFVGDWISLNLLSLDEKRVIVEENQIPLIDFLKKRVLTLFLAHSRIFTHLVVHFTVLRWTFEERANCIHTFK